MSHVSTVFSQLLDFLPKSRFDSFVGQHRADRYVKTFSCWRQLLALLYAQATGKDSLREIELGLRANRDRWYHLGLETVARSTLAHANENRPWQIYESLFYELLARCRRFSPMGNRFGFENPLYALDATVISLCLSVFPWAKYRRQKGALKLHVLLDVRSAIPEFLVASDGRGHEMPVARKTLPALPPGSILVMDRAYIDYGWFRELDAGGIFFVTRTKKSTNLFVVRRNAPAGRGVLADEIVGLGGDAGMREYAGDLRRVTYLDTETGKLLVFITNNLILPAADIAAVYRSRWQIEIFFKWIKQNLKIKSFLGTSKNAVLTQVWVAMIFYLLLTYVRFKTGVTISLLEFTRIIRELLMVPMPLIDALGIPYRHIAMFKNRDSPQMSLF